MYVTRPERLYCVLVLGLQYSCVLGFPNTHNQFCIISNTIQYYTIQQGKWSREKQHMRKRLNERKRRRKSKESEGELKMWRRWEIKEEEEENLLNVRIWEKWWKGGRRYNIGCSKKKCKGFLLITPAMKHTERQTRYHLIELNLTDIVVYDF